MRTAVATALRRPYSAERSLTGWLARAASPPSATRQYQYGTFIESLMSQGLWPLFDLLHIHGATDQTLSKENLVSPLFPYTETAAPTWSADRGFTFNGTTQLLANTFTLSLHGSALKKNHAHIGCYALTAGTNTGWDFGDSASLACRVRTGTNGAIRVNGGTSLATLSGGAIPLHVMGIRTLASAHDCYRNGVFLSSQGTASAALPANIVEVGRAMTLFSDRQIFMTHLGGGMTAAQALSLYTAALALAQSIGAA